MNTEFNQLTNAGRRALVTKDWAALQPIVQRLQTAFENEAETYYLAGVLARVQVQPRVAVTLFERGLNVDAKRYDIAVELANVYSVTRQNGKAAEVLGRYADKLERSPRYLDMAGTVYTSIGMSEKAFPLYQKALELQPDAPIFKVNLATCAVFLGDIDLGERLYRELIAATPDHRQNHYHFSRLKRASDDEHIQQMLSVIDGSNNVARDIPIYFALGKEYEDLGQWEESFRYYQKGCDGIKAQTQHDVQTDIDQIEQIKQRFSSDWLASKQAAEVTNSDAKTPIFVLGLPRTGTTLAERILSSHADVSSVGETMFLQLAIRQLVGVENTHPLTAADMHKVADIDPQALAQIYTEALSYRIGDEPYFIEKLPFNFLYAGLIAAAWPNARIVNLVRHPMDACFSMYKQVFTWAYKYSYSLDDLGRYYVAYDGLRQHWQSLLGDRFVQVQYEALVSDQETQTRSLLDRLSLPFDQACLEFEKNTAPSTTASSVQVRSKVHTGSVAKWRRYQSQLQPLADHLQAAGIDIDDVA